MKQRSHIILLCASVIIGLANPASAALTVVEAPGVEVGPTTNFEIVHDTSLLLPFNTEFWDLRLVGNSAGDAAYHGTISGAAPDIFRSSENPSGFIDSTAFIRIYGRGDLVVPTPFYYSGAEVGADNWIYLSRNGNADSAFHEPSSWVQFEFGFDTVNDTLTATVLRYVHDPANPTADFSLVQAIAAVDAVPEPSVSGLAGLGLLSLLLRRRRVSA